ncbi:unnamed protein product [Phytophthora fragariaefolia]|uniref:Unnamed protein product n=1 Tax=Phytophthora fragariaefolia TaxID=1490495 RepID=A0A9W6WYS5_9STRA|nr:unnamed protein product [Phytophthora fragariaefolia]
MNESALVSHDEPDNALATVDAVAERLRDCREGHDLLYDQRDFVDFVFRNSTLLKMKWLQVVSQIRYGTRSTANIHVDTRNPTPSVSVMEMFCREFGVDGAKTVLVEASSHPMPERAQIIEERMTRLGFQHESKTVVYEETRNFEEEVPTDKSIRPETTSVQKEFHIRHDAAVTVDDMLLFQEDPTPQNLQDMQRLIYELKVRAPKTK